MENIQLISIVYFDVSQTDFIHFYVKQNKVIFSQFTTDERYKLKKYGEKKRTEKKETYKRNKVMCLNKTRKTRKKKWKYEIKPSEAHEGI